jgi:hypothetical protein
MTFPEKQRAGKYGRKPALAHRLDADARDRGRTTTIPLYSSIGYEQPIAVDGALLFT